MSTNVNLKSVPAPNFNLKEKNILLNIIATKYKNIIEDQKTDRTSVEEKSRAWDKIAGDFNSILPNVYRPASCLKKFYENKKKEIRKLVAEEKKEILLTGGGPPKKICKDENFDLMLSILNPKSVHGLNNPHDDDGNTDMIAIDSIEDQENSQLFELVTEQSLEEENEQEAEHQQTADVHNQLKLPAFTSLVMPDQQDKESSKKTEHRAGDTDGLSGWKKYTPSKLKLPISSPLVTPKSKVRSAEVKTRQHTNTVRALSSSAVGEKYDILMDKRLVIVDKQIEQIQNDQSRAEELHKLKIELVNLEIKKLKQEIDINKNKNKLLFT